MRLLRSSLILLGALVLVRPLSFAAEGDLSKSAEPSPTDKTPPAFFNADSAMGRPDSPSTWSGFQPPGTIPFGSFQPFSSMPTSPSAPGRYGNSYANDRQTQMANYMAAQQMYQMYQQWQNSHSRTGGGSRPMQPGIGATVGGDAGASGSCMNAHNNAMLGLVPYNPFSSCFVRGTPVCTVSDSLTPIEAIQVGQRVSGESTEAIDPANLRQIELQAIKRDGSTATMVLLRSGDWLESHQAKVGESIKVNLPGCGVNGTATVTAIRPCPAIESGTGAIVTGTIRHSSAPVINLRIEGLAEPIGTTVNHWFCSEDRNGFVRADELSKGERLRSRTESANVLRLEPRAGTEAVYNLEVSGGKYSISRLGLLVRDAGTNR
jgi:hypothetical protein